MLKYVIFLADDFADYLKTTYKGELVNETASGSKMLYASSVNTQGSLIETKVLMKTEKEELTLDLFLHYRDVKHIQHIEDPDKTVKFGFQQK